MGGYVMIPKAGFDGADGFHTRPPVLPVWPITASVSASAQGWLATIGGFTQNLSVQEIYSLEVRPT